MASGISEGLNYLSVSLSWDPTGAGSAAVSQGCTLVLSTLPLSASPTFATQPSCCFTWKTLLSLLIFRGFML